MEEVLAWRAWRLEADDQGPLLRSLSWEVAWPGPVLVADQAPDQGNERGVYAVRDRHSHWCRGPRARVLGLVGLSGRVLEHERGYRAERATVRALFLLPPRQAEDTLEDRSGVAAGLAARYACGVRLVRWPRREREQWARAHQEWRRLRDALAQVQQAMDRLADAFHGPDDLVVVRSALGPAFLVGRPTSVGLARDYYNGLPPAIHMGGPDRLNVEASLLWAEG